MLLRLATLERLKRRALARIEKERTDRWKEPKEKGRRQLVPRYQMYLGKVRLTLVPSLIRDNGKIHPPIARIGRYEIPAVRAAQVSTQPTHQGKSR